MGPVAPGRVDRRLAAVAARVEAGADYGYRGEYNEGAPELSRFFGIIIRMFAEAGSPHHGAHFHAYYQEEVGIFSIDPVELIAGSLPGRQRRLVEAWAELRQAELAAGKPAPIEPLR